MICISRYALARAIGWADRWTEAHHELARAASAFPSHAQTAAVLAARESYYFGGRTTRAGSTGSTSSHQGTSTSTITATSSGGEARVSTVGFDAFDLGLDKKQSVHVSRGPLLDPAGCAAAVAAVEAHAASKSGWATSRHYSVPTTDVPVNEVRLFGCLRRESPVRCRFFYLMRVRILFDLFAFLWVLDLH